MYFVYRKNGLVIMMSESEIETKHKQIELDINDVDTTDTLYIRKKKLVVIENNDKIKKNRINILKNSRRRINIHNFYPAHSQFCSWLKNGNDICDCGLIKTKK